jgi:hypothetical protein
VRIDYIVAKAERGYTRGEQAAIGGGVAAGLGGVIGEATNVERHNNLAGKVNAARQFGPGDKKALKKLKRNVNVSRGVWGAGTLATLGGVAHRANRLNREQS